MSPSFYAAALADGLRGEDDESARRTALGDSIALNTPSSCGIYFQCRAARHNGALDQARALATALPPPERANRMHSKYDPYVVGVRAETAVLDGWDDAEEHLDRARCLGLENDFVMAQLLRAVGRLHHDGAALKESVVAWEAIGARFERACTLVLLPDRSDEGLAEPAALGCTAHAPSWW